MFGSNVYAACCVDDNKNNNNDENNACFWMPDPFIISHVFVFTIIIIIIIFSSISIVLVHVFNTEKNTYDNFGRHFG